jgi:hypothetical protein
MVFINLNTIDYRCFGHRYRGPVYYGFGQIGRTSTSLWPRWTFSFAEIEFFIWLDGLGFLAEVYVIYLTRVHVLPFLIVHFM